MHRLLRNSGQTVLIAVVLLCKSFNTLEQESDTLDPARILGGKGKFWSRWVILHASLLNHIFQSKIQNYFLQNELDWACIESRSSIP